ncbi:MAG: exodeoxyribonuclease subunit alpha [Desulfacinum sp.]|jgi:exodeoxyribonuclease V alpha subunit|nr:exodeoxyribonuclease subunit alpha [Desulfacinum sp.]
MILERLKERAQKGWLRSLDWQFARWVGRVSGDDTEAVLLAAALASLRVAEGDVCVDLSHFAGRRLFADSPAEGGAVPAPPLAEWLDALRRSSAVSASPAAAWTHDPSPIPRHSLTPLVLDGTRVYLTRYWAFEEDLARRLLERAEGWTDVEPAALRPHLDRLFPAPDPPGGVDWQRAAAAVAAMKRLCIISGGPGTGKTHTVKAVLAILQALRPGRPLRAALAAPTGKAAARITESLQKNPSFAEDVPFLRDLPRAAVTLHRLIGIREGRSVPRHNPENPLHVDVLVIDEASMIDLPLMARTVAALPPHARLILLGDKDQLASVEAGSVFADLCGRGRTPAYSERWRERIRAATGMEVPAESENPREAPSPLDDCTVFLRKSYRFHEKGGIGRLAAAIRDGGELPPLSGPEEENASDTNRAPEVRLRAVPAPRLPRELGRVARERFAPVSEAAGVEEALARLDAFRILCALREGPAGAAAVNGAVEEALSGTARHGAGSRPIRGKPVLITRNDYDLQLFNGDVGLFWPDERDGRLYAWFRAPDGHLRKVRPLRLPPHETAYAMTVHKSQGSELDEVLLLLPPEDSRVLTRELIYTAVTRARRAVEIWGSAERLQAAVSRRTQRTSGLHERLFPSTRRTPR